MPTISIITPLHNKGPFVAETITSVQAQTWANWEMIVVENHSSDDGTEQVERVASEDERLRLIRAPDSVRGPGAARNFGLGEARGEWVLFLDADDLITARHLESLIQVGRSTSAHVVASDWVEFTEGSWEWGCHQGLHTAIQELKRHHAAGSLVPQPKISVQESSIAYAPWAVHCGLVRCDALDAQRCWVESLDEHPSEDTAFWFRVLLGRAVAYTRQATAIYRTETPNFRNTHRNLEQWAEAMNAIYKENHQFLESVGSVINSNHAECLMRMWCNLGSEAANAGLPGNAIRAYYEANYWLSLCSWNRPAVVARKLIGARLFNQILSLIR